MPGLCAVHKKRIPPGQFGYMLWYMVKSPRKEYSIGRRRIPDEKTGNARFKQNSRNIRPGHCVKVFHLMREIYLDQLAMAGGEGRKSLQQIKYEALRDYRRKLGGGTKVDHNCNSGIAFRDNNSPRISILRSRVSEAKNLHFNESRFFAKKRRLFATFGT
jgi:hypothetical protein